METTVERAARMAQAILGISTPETEDLVARYCEFLTMRSKFRLHRHSAEIDLLWHLHVLDMPRYREFCLKNVGRVVDHELPDEPLATAALSRAQASFCADGYSPIHSAVAATSQCSNPGTPPKR